ncbi:MAG: hypothetical protein IJ644_00225 [Oscillospiraceae bacterium]|nr:hypothetical protein [Oscillospiraceae bacterium]
MNRKLRKTLKEIYASEKPSEYPDFLKEIKKERDKKQFRFAAPVMALFLAAFLGLYGYCELLEARNHSAEPQEETLEHLKQATQQKQPIAFSPAESITTQMETVSETSTSNPALSAELSTTQTTVFTTTHTTIRMETTVPETAVTQIHLPNQTVTETVPEVFAEETETFLPETTAPPVPEVPAEITAIPETTAVLETTVTEETQESEWRCLDLSRVSDVEALQASYWELRRQEAMNWSMNSRVYEDSGRQADEMLSELTTLHRENGNPYYERYHSILVNGIAPDSHTRAYTELKDTFMNELLTDLENTISPDVFQAIQASQQDFQEKFDTFWEGDLQLSYEMGSLYTDYLEMELIQYRVLLLMNYFY